MLLRFLAKRAIPGIERVNDDSYERVIGPADASSWIRVRAATERPELLLEIGHADPRAIPGIVRRVRRMFDLDADLRAVHAVFAADPLLKQAIDLTREILGVPADYRIGIVPASDTGAGPVTGGSA